jgi:hypothetical protein
MDIPDVVRRHIRTHKGVRAASRALGIDAAYLVRLRDGKKTNPGEDTLEKLGIERVTKYVRIQESA